MRIVHIIDYFQPKLGYQETFLAREQSRMGHEVFVVTSERYAPCLYPANEQLLGSRIREAGFFEEEGIRTWRLKPLFELPRAFWIGGLEAKVRELKPALVVVHGIGSLSAWRVARLKIRSGQFRLIYDDHTLPAWARSTSRILYPLLRPTFIRTIRDAADALVAVADACKDFMVQRYGIPPERITVIPLGADDELFKVDEAAREQTRRGLSLDEGNVLFIYTGKIIPERRLSLLVEAVKLLEGHDSIKVLLVGDGAPTCFESLRQDIEDAGLEDRFILHHAVLNEDLPRFYSAADVAVWPSGPSISQREAMACGLPIIISEDSMVTELVAQENGLVCRENDASDLAQQMTKLLDPTLRREMGRNSKRFVEERLSWKVTARQFIDVVS